MIDIHSHILYGCDDGAKSIEQSIEMIKTAQIVGITDIFCTPHYMEDGYKIDKDMFSQKLDILRRKLQEENIDVNLYSGNEVFVFPNIVQSFDSKINSLNGSRYVLMELPLIENVNYLDDVLYELLSSGKVPIIAHPERYLKVQKDFSAVKKLIDNGALLQINANSLVGRYGKDAEKVAVKLCKSNMVHFVASDAHSVGGYKLLNKSLECLKKFVSEDKFRKITYENQRRVALDQDIDVTEYVEQKKHCFFRMPFFYGKGD